MFGTIKNKEGEELDYTFTAGTSGSDFLAIIGHGVTGNKDRPFLVALSDALANAGIANLRFSFSGNGASGGKFAESTISKEVDDLGVVLDAVENLKVCYIGHSMGGAVGVLRAAQDNRIRYLISLAGMVHTRAFTEREFGTVTPGAGFMWDDEKCPLSEAYVRDLTQINTVLGAGGRINVPWLLIHGTEDDVVPLQDSIDIAETTKAVAQLIRLEGSNHVFGAAATEPMCKEVTAWIKKTANV